MHELKHDGWRIIARKSGARVRIWTRHGKEQSASFVAIANALRFLPVTSCVLDGEAVTHTADGWPDFYGLRSSAGAARAVLFAFDLPELDGVDMRGRPLTERRSLLEELVFEPREGLRLSEIYDGPGDVLISKRRSLSFRSLGRLVAALSPAALTIREGVRQARALPPAASLNLGERLPNLRQGEAEVLGNLSGAAPCHRPSRVTKWWRPAYR